MVDHVSLGVSELERSRHFYDAALQPLGLVLTVDFQARGSDYGAIPGQLGVEFTITAEIKVSPLRGMHICFRASHREAVRAFHTAALAAGGKMTDNRAYVRNTTQTTMQLSFWILTDTGSKQCVMRPRLR
jgi:catechol 2,3-dioxygenase-like lactoylglutathione lyase family enzyme